MEYPIDTAGFEAHVFVLAVSVNGELNVAPFEGVVTVMSEIAAAATVMFSSTSSCVFLPQHFTCNTCFPADVATLAVNDVGSIIAVPLSIEYPIDTAGTPAHMLVLAVTVNGDVSCAPLVGVETVMAWIDAVQPTSASAANKNLFMSEPLMTRRCITGINSGGIHCRCL